MVLLPNGEVVKMSDKLENQVAQKLKQLRFEIASNAGYLEKNPDVKGRIEDRIKAMVAQLESVV